MHVYNYLKEHGQVVIELGKGWVLHREAEEARPGQEEDQHSHQAQHPTVNRPEQEYGILVRLNLPREEKKDDIKS